MSATIRFKHGCGAVGRRLAAASAGVRRMVAQSYTGWTSPRTGGPMTATEGGPEGIYNIVDDDPAPVRDWLPYLAQVIGAKPPTRLPAWLVRPLLGPHAVALMTTARGSANAKVRRELAWTPLYASWRQGFRDGLD